MLDERLSIAAAFLLLCAGGYFTALLRFFQLTALPRALHISLFSAFKKQKKGGVSPFRALSTALAGSVGTGNIAGVASALAIGGPGAVFWMWVSALIGMALKYAEVVLAVKYRAHGSDGEWRGGAMYCITRGMGQSWAWLARVFCALAMLASFGVGNMVQVNTIASAANEAVSAFYPLHDARLVGLGAGLFTAVAVGSVTFGGAKRIGAAAGFLVPFMSLLYIGATLLVIVPNIDKLPGVLGDIVSGAFAGFKPALGGAAGFTLAQAFKTGMMRGIFSNEAGLGSAPIAHAAAETANASEQGLLGIFEVFLDTIVICSLTAFMVLAAGIAIPYGDAGANGMTLSVEALATVMSVQSAGLFLAVAVLLFAFCSILTWSLYGARCAEFLLGERGVFYYRIAFLCAIVLGALLEVSLVWRLGEALNSLMALPNLIMLIALAPLVKSAVTRDKMLSR